METVKDYNFPLNSLEDKQQQHEKNKHCAILPSFCRHCQSKAKNSRIWARAMPFLPLTFDLLILKVVSDSHVTWATFMPILAFLGLFST